MIPPNLQVLGAYAVRRMVKVHVWRSTDTTDAGGGSATVWSRIDDVLVELVAPSATERETAAQEGVEITHAAVLEIGTPVRRGDRLVVGPTTVELISDPLTATHSAVARAGAKQEPWDEPL